jgi:signal transduction histidine kinase
MRSEPIAKRRTYDPGLRALRARSSRALAPAGLKTETVRALPVVLPVGVAGLALALAAVVELIADPPGASTFAGAAALLAAATLAEALPLPIEGVSVGATSLAIVFIVATAVIYAWPEAALVGFLTMALVEVARRRSPLRIAFNTGLYVCAATLAGVAAAAVDGDDVGALVAAACLGSVAFYVVDMVFLSAVIARTRGTGFARSLGTYIYATSIPFLVMASLTVTLVLLWDQSPYAAIVVIGPLITIALYERWLHRALDRLREFDRLKDEFIAVISHELRTPLTSVYGAAVTLRRRDVDDDIRDTLLRIVSDEAGRLARLLDDALSASRLSAGRETLAIEDVDAAEVARSAVDATRPRLPQGFELELDYAADRPPVRADPDKLQQVLVNLIENAIKYSPSGGRIDVRIEGAGPAMRISVHDEGIGIPPRDHERIFERFHRVDPNMTKSVGGSGLGLYICRELVRRMDGRIWVESREGEGSTFTFELPVAGTAV